MSILSKKIFAAVIVLFVVTVLSFILLHNLPGDPCIARLGPSSTQQGLTQCRHELGLDQSLPGQYVRYVDRALHGDLGTSYLNGQTVGKAIKQALPVTVEILIVSQLIALIVAIPVGILAALRPDGVFDQLSTGAAFGLLNRLRRRRSRYLLVGFAAVGAATIQAFVMACDYTTDYVDIGESGPYLLSIAGIVLTLLAFVGLQRYTAKRVPARRVRKHECPFCGFPVRDSGHCEGCGRAVVAPCMRCEGPRRVGTPHCGVCGAT